MQLPTKLIRYNKKHNCEKDEMKFLIKNIILK